MVSVGTVLNNRYKLLSLLGSGGTAHVYLAKDLFLDREVAVKVLRYDFNNDERSLKRFHREARAISELSHDHIVSLYDVDHDGYNQYIVMEYVDGMDLKKYLRQNYPLSVMQVVDIMKQITEAVYYAHQKGIIHRDLKPQNVLIRPDGQIKITDFGIATSLNDVSMTQTNTLVGSIHYLSPEQTRGQSATNQSDIYALGIMMYELIMGNVPFNGDSAVSIAMKHFQQPLPDVVGQARQTVPQSVENIILQATAKNPANRFQSALDMYQALDKCLLLSQHNQPKYVEPKVTYSSAEQTQVYQTFQGLSDANQAARNREDRFKRNEAPLKPVAKPKKSMKKWLAIGAGLVGLLILIWGAMTLLTPTPSVTVPDVSGLSQTDATKKLTESGLVVVGTKTQEDKDIAKDQVIGTDPAVNSSVKKNSQITLIISSGYSSGALSNYVGGSYDSAYADLTQKGLIVEKKTASSATVQEGDVTAQSIAAGTSVTQKNQVITLTVSSGPQDYKGQTYTSVKSQLEAQGASVSASQQESDTYAQGQIISQTATYNTANKAYSFSFIVSSGAKTITMPNYVNTNAQSAQSALENNGMSVTIVSQESSSVSEGNVISQSVTPGTKVTTGTSITLTVSKGNSNKMPNLLGSSQSFAESQLSALGVNVIVQTAKSSTYAKGTVAKQSVTAGTTLTSGMTVTITISSGSDD